jgi:hypothetical protein
MPPQNFIGGLNLINKIKFKIVQRFSDVAKKIPFLEAVLYVNSLWKLFSTMFKKDSLS